ncbi:MAG TPA: sulfotransferase [Bryobacteraceae bacterium]|nr:sulfotransferase [Bryobacteraceae bacterium]
MVPQSNSVRRLPNFFIVGAPKAGTTSLYHYLDQHPQIYMSPIKEPNFFSTEVRAENFEASQRPALERDARAVRRFLDGPMNEKRFGGIVTELADYERLFTNAGNATAVGEASVCYLWSSTAPGKIASMAPDARIVIILRDPAARSFSQYAHGLSVGAIKDSFREHIRKSLILEPKQFCSVYPFLEFGLYAEQVRRYRDLFGPNVWIGFHEDFRANPLKEYRRLLRFLEVDDAFIPDLTQQYLEGLTPRVRLVGALRRKGIWGAVARLTPVGWRPYLRRAFTRAPGAVQMSAADRQYLIDFFRADIHKLETLLSIDLSHWLQ